MNANELKNYISVSTVLQYYNTIKGSGNGSWYCPIHELDGKNGGHSPSLIAKDSVGVATCAAKRCFDGDDIFGIISKMENININYNFKKVLDIAKRIGNVDVVECTYREKVYDLNSRHLTYLDSFGILPDTCRRFQLKARDSYILYPQIKNGEKVGFKGISIEKNIETGKKKQFFEGTDKSCKLWFESILKNQKNVVFCEGEKDCLLLNQEIEKSENDDLVAFTFTTGANGVPKNLKNFILKFKFRKIFIIYDNDTAGKKGATRLLKKIIDTGVEIEILYFPENFKSGYDITDWFIDGNSIESLFQLKKEVYNNSENNNINQFKSRLVTTDFVQKSLDPEIIIKSNVEILDEKAPLIIGQNTIITGRTGHGKTCFAINLLNYILESNRDIIAVIFSLELQKKAFFQRIMASKYDIEKWKIERGFIDKDGKAYIDEKNIYMEQAFNYQKTIFEKLLIYDNLFYIEELDQEIDKVIKCFPNNNIYVLIDYVNILNFKKKTIDNYIHVEISKWLTRKAKEKNIHIQAICQANRVTTEKSDGFARTENLADSDQYGRDAYIVYSIKADDERFYLNPTKNRNGKAEVISEFLWNPVSNKIYLQNETALSSNF